MAIEGIGNGSNGIAFLVSAGVTYEIIAAACSSPQTTELNAHKRAGTLMKWVNIGLAQSVLFIGIAAVVDRQHTKPIIYGGGLAIGLLYAQYAYAKRSGLASNEPGTEEYGDGDSSDNVVALRGAHDAFDIFEGFSMVA